MDDVRCIGGVTLRPFIGLDFDAGSDVFTSTSIKREYKQRSALTRFIPSPPQIAVGWCVPSSSALLFVGLLLFSFIHPLLSSHVQVGPCGGPTVQAAEGDCVKGRWALRHGEQCGWRASHLSFFLPAASGTGRQKQVRKGM
jgi:hypothetical protein